MQYAMTPAGERVSPARRDDCVCEMCGAAVVARMGTIVVHHWAHVSLGDCDSWSEPMTPWHRDWQSQWADRCREVILGNHRADVVTDDGSVLEFQHSTISSAEVLERLNHYLIHGQKIAWIFDAVDAFASGRIALGGPYQDGRKDFAWVHPRLSIAPAVPNGKRSRSRYACWLDLGDALLDVRSFKTKDGKTGGWGYVVPKEVFLRRLNAHHRLAA